MIDDSQSFNNINKTYNNKKCLSSFKFYCNQVFSCNLKITYLRDFNSSIQGRRIYEGGLVLVNIEDGDFSLGLVVEAAVAHSHDESEMVRLSDQRHAWVENTCVRVQVEHVCNKARLLSELISINLESLFYWMLENMSQ